VALDDFRGQNVLDELLVQELDPAEAVRQAAPWPARRLRVEFVPIAGFCALIFLCDAMEVVHAESILAAT
jgi:hypothetical protein